MTDDTGLQPAVAAEYLALADVLAHLEASEGYHQACVDGEVKSWLARQAARGATDIASVNAIGIADKADNPSGQLLAEWRQQNADTRRRFREGGEEIDTSVGAYPRRWQAFHVAGELATHADDMFVAADAEIGAERRRWRARFSRFALAEEKPDLVIARTAVPPDSASLVDAEEEAGRRDPYRSVAALTHTIARTTDTST